MQEIQAKGVTCFWISTIDTLVYKGYRMTPTFAGAPSWNLKNVLDYL